MQEENYGTITGISSVAEIGSLKDAEILARLKQLNITSKKQASETFKGLSCLRKIRKVLADVENEKKPTDLTKVWVPDTPFSVADAIKWLESASDDYYNYGKSEITDAEFDWIYEATKKVVPNHPFFMKRVRAVTHSDKKLLLDNPVYTLYKVPISYDKESGLCDYKASLNALYEWMFKRAASSKELFFCSPKFDGLTMILYYKDGILERAATGGDGIEGADVTAHAYEIEGIPKSLSTGETCEVRGEVLMRNSIFRTLQQAGLDIVTPRGAAVGTLALKDMAMVRARKLSFCAWGYLPHGQDFMLNEDEKFRVLRSLGFERVGELGLITIADIEKIFSYYQSLDSARRMQVSSISPIWEDAAMDGIVITLNSYKSQQSAGYGNIEPNFSAAFKFAGDRHITPVTSIEWQVSRTGVVKPVVNFEPIILEGTCVQRATGDNYRRIEADKISVGCRVLVTKAGLTIPKILAVADRKNAEYFSTPECCPVCGTLLVLNDSGVDLICSNSSCPAQVFDRIRHFFTSVVPDKCGIGENFLQIIIDSGMVKDVADLYTVSEYALRAMDGIGEFRAKQFTDAIVETKQMPLYKLFHALSIHGVGEKLSRKIADVLGRDAELLFSPTALTYQMMRDRLCNVKGRKLPEPVIRNFCTWFTVPENQILLTRLKEAGMVILFDSEIQSGSKGKYCITGVTDLPRKELITLLNRHGYVFDSNVTQETKYLICNVQKNSGKQQKAQRMGIKVITEVEMLAMLEGLQVEMTEQVPHKDIMELDKSILKEKAKDLLDIVETNELNMFD
jgi:DNA ligase (NAD+)